ncbi:9010_t:CDS:1, partial [Cetraspora pellucida]
PKKESYANYNYLTIGQQLCYNYYMHIVEPDRHQTKAPSSVEIDKDQSYKYNENQTKNDIVAQ